MTATLASHRAAKRHRAARCSGCCKIKPAHQPNQVSSVFFLLDWPFIDVYWRASGALANARGLPRRRARWVALSGRHLPESQKRLPCSSRRGRGPRRRAAAYAPRARRARAAGARAAHRRQAAEPSYAVLTDATRCRAMTAAAGWRPPWRWTTRTSARSTIGAHATMCAELRPRLRPRTRRAVQRYGHSWSPYAIAALG